MPPLSTKVEFCRLYPKKLNYLFLAVFAFFSPFCYAKTAFSYSPDILSPCTPDVTMVKNVVKSVSKKMICGHHFEAKKQPHKIAPSAARKSIESRKETHQPSHVVCPTESNENYVVNHKANYMVKLCGRSRELHIISSSTGVVL